MDRIIKQSVYCKAYDRTLPAERDIVAQLIREVWSLCYWYDVVRNICQILLTLCTQPYENFLYLLKSTF